MFWLSAGFWCASTTIAARLSTHQHLHLIAIMYAIDDKLPDLMNFKSIQ